MRQNSRIQEKSEIDSKYRVNNKISSPQVRVIDERGQQLGVLGTREAIRIAEDAGLDLVEVAPDAKPPVCRILDFGKLKYKEQKKAAEARKKTAVHVVKELRVRYRTDPHDLETKVKKAREFISHGDRVKFEMRFRGREVVYQDLGREVFDKIIQKLEDVAAVEDNAPLLGNKMILTLAPKALVAKVKPSA